MIPGAAAREELAAVPEIVRFGASAFGLLAHTAAYRPGGAWLDAHLAGLVDNRAAARTASLSSSFPRSASGRRRRPTSPGWTAGLSASSRIPGRVFLERGRVALSEGDFFGAGAEGFVRLNFAAAPSVLEEAVRRMAGAIGGA